MALSRSRGFPESEFEERQSSAAPHPVHGWSLLTDDTLSGFKDRWDRLQVEFVVKPGEAALAAEDLIRDIGEALAASTVRRRTELNHVAAGSVRFPEELWITLQRCRLLMNAIQAPAE